MVLSEYMARLDGEKPAEALDLVEPDMRFLLALPGRHITGQSRDDFADYIAGRNPVEREHVIQRRAVDGDLEVVYGVVTEKGEPTGAFLSAAKVSPEGRIHRYLSFFDTSFRLVDEPGDAPGPSWEERPQWSR
jgi:hypothetical protein